MGSFAFYVYKVMFMSNTSFESDFVHIYIKTETTYDQLLNQVDPYLTRIDDFDVLAKRKKYSVRPGKYILNKGMSNNDIINSIREKDSIPSRIHSTSPSKNCA